MKKPKKKAELNLLDALNKAVEEGKSEIHQVKVQGKAGDGKIYQANFDVMFPKGTKIIGVSQSIPEEDVKKPKGEA